MTTEIVGFNHDDLTAGGKAAYTFGLKNLMADTHYMNGTRSNKGSFVGSYMYSYLQSDVLANFPDDLKTRVKFIDKVTGVGGGINDSRTDSMKIFLFSGTEIGRTKGSGDIDEGSCYAVFSGNSSRIKKLSNGSGSENSWWTRSPYRNSGQMFHSAAPTGIVGNNYADMNYGVCFGFCV